MPSRLTVTADDKEFDPEILQHFRDEGFHVEYLAYTGNEKTYRSLLKGLADDLELSETYAVVGESSKPTQAPRRRTSPDNPLTPPAYGDAATIALDHYLKPQPKVAALIAYYPLNLPNPAARYPPHLHVQAHLAGTQHHPHPLFNSYTYPNADIGFAERDLPQFDKVNASLAWTRTLGVLRKAFKLEPDLEKVWEEHVALEFASRDAAATMRTMVEEPYVNHIPTLTGGIGRKDLLAFYRDYFIPGNPPSLVMKLVSRTVGVDGVVDEMVVSFKHTQEVPWMLPGVPATDEQVHVVVVGVVCIRGGKLYHEHIYWDQASVLVQIGLLDPKFVPESMRAKGLERLPVYGKETAEKVLDESSQPSNELISSWKDRFNGDSDDA